MAAASSEKAAGFTFVNNEIRAGTKKAVAVPVARLPAGSWIEMPTVVVHGSKPGPCIWLSGAIHGDELNGIEITRRLLGLIDPKQLAGTVLAVPIVNVLGVVNESRYLPDRRDLNRSFPGSSKGSMAGRMANLFFSNIAARCELGLDFHTGSNGRSNLPQLRGDFEDKKTNILATAFRPPVLLQTNLRDGSLRGCAKEQGIRVLLYEAGEAHRFDEEAIQLGVEGTLRVLKTMKMLGAAPKSESKLPRRYQKSGWVRAGRSGFCLLQTELGSRVKAGQPVAKICDSIGESHSVVKSKWDGLVIGLLRTALVHRGDAVVHIAEKPS